MKKVVITLLIASCLTFSLVSCGGDSSTSESNSKTLSLTDVNVPNDSFEYKFISATTDKRIDPSAPKSYFTYYEAKTAGYVYLATTFEIKNTGANDKSADDFMDIKYVINDKEYTTFSVIEEPDGSDFTYANITNIKPLETRKVIFLGEIPESDINAEVKIITTIDEKEVSNTFSLESIKPEKKYINLGETITKDDYAEVTFDSLEYTDRIDPSSPTSYYNFYEIKDPNNIYLALGITVKNLKSSDLESEHVLYVKATLNEKYKYDSFAAIEESNGSNFRYGNMSPLETAKGYYIIELPKDAEQGTVELEINLNGEKLYLKK